MSALVMGTNAVTLDEPGYNLKELIQQAPDSSGMHRYQIITVIRQGDKRAELRRDLGLARSYSVPEFEIPGGGIDHATGRIWIEHTVGELIDIADHLRSDRYDRPPTPAPSDLVQGYCDAYDKRKLHRRRRSMVGERVRIQRD